MLTATEARSSEMTSPTWATLRPALAFLMSQFSVCNMVLPPQYLLHWTHSYSLKMLWQCFQLWHIGCKNAWCSNMKGLKAHTEASSDVSQKGALPSYPELRLEGCGWERFRNVAETCQWMSHLGLLKGCWTGPASPAQARIEEVPWNLFLGKHQAVLPGTQLRHL